MIPQSNTDHSTSTAQPDHVDEAIAEARRAARLAGVDLSRPDADSHLRLARARGQGLTSFAFHVEGLESGPHATALEEKLNAIPGVEAVVVYSTHMVWISAADNLTPDDVHATLEENGVHGYLTNSSLRRRAARLEIQELRRRRMRRHADAHQRATLAAEQRKRGASLSRRSRVPADGTEVLHTARELITRGRLIVAVLLGAPVVILQLFPSLQFDWWQWMCLGLSTVVVGWSGWPFHRAMLGGLRRGMSALDSASSIAILVAYFFSLGSLFLSVAGDPTWRSVQVWLAGGWADSSFDGAIFFDVACGVTILLLFGRLLSRRNELRSKSVLSQLSPPAAREITVVRKDRKGKSVKKQISTAEIRVADDILVGPNEHVPSDGEVVSGKAVVDMGPVGGADRTVEVAVGDRIFAGARNYGQTLKIRVHATGSHTRLAAMHRWFHSAVRDENRLSQLANRSASLLVPWALGIAVLNFGMWWLALGSVDAAMATSLSVLVAVAPVALALSAPLALRLGLARAAAYGTLLKDTATIHRLAEIEAIVFNRLGTLTTEPMNVIGVTAAQGERADLVLRVAAALSMESTHAVSKAIVRADRESRDANSGDDSIPQWLETGDVNIAKDGTFTGSVDIPFKGELRRVSATVWRPRDMGQLRDPHLATAALSGGSPVVVSWKGRERGVINVADTVKNDAVAAVDRLEDMDIETHMLSRDTYPVARRFANSLGISTVMAGVAPNDKAATVRGLHAQGVRVAMVGDQDVSGSLDVADVGILMGAADNMDAARSDVLMVRDDVVAIPELINLVRHVRNTVDWNIWLSWAYNVVAIVAALTGVMNPLLATLAMLGASAMVEWRSARILHANYVDANLRHTHTWQGWTARLRIGWEQKRREELRAKAIETARGEAMEEGRDLREHRDVQ